MKLSYGANPNLQSLIRSGIHLIRGATFRPRYTLNPLGGLLSLGELIDIYHNRKATIPHDKVYALLGMSSDPTAAGLTPDYSVPWKTLLQRIVEFILVKGISIETWGDRELAVIKSKGRILGRISSVESDSSRYDRQHVGVNLNKAPIQSWYKPSPSYYGDGALYDFDSDASAAISVYSSDDSDYSDYKYRSESIRWTLHVAAKSIQEGDIICLLQGAQKPAIIRACKDYFAIILIAVTVLQQSGDANHQGPLTSMKAFSIDLLLAWNWEEPPLNLQDRVGLETSMAINTLVPEYIGPPEEISRLCNVALVLGDSENYEVADKRVQEVLGGFRDALDTENLHTLTDLGHLALIYKSRMQWTKAEKLFLQIIQIRKRVQGTNHQDTLNTIATLASTYMDRTKPTPETMQLGTIITDRIRDNAPIAGEEMAKVIKLFIWDLILLLLDLERDKVQITEEVVVAVAKSYKHLDQMSLLFERRGTEVKITEEVLKAAARTGNAEVVSLLLDWCDTDSSITKDVMAEAARSGSSKLMQLLLRRGTNVKITEDIVLTAIRRGKVKVMSLLLDQRGNEVTITQNVVEAAARSSTKMMSLLLDQRCTEIRITADIVNSLIQYHESKDFIDRGNMIGLLLKERRIRIAVTPGLVRMVAKSYNDYDMRMLLTYYSNDVKITEEVVKTAAGRGPEMMRLLLDQRGAEIKITEEVIVAAASNHNIYTTMVMLLDQRGAEIKITERVLVAVARDPLWANSTMRLLLDQRDAEFKITEEVVKVAAASRSTELLPMLLDHRGAEFKITEEVLVAVASSHEAYEKMALLLDRRGLEFKITERVLIAVAGYSRQAHKVMALLLRRRSPEFKITEEVVKAAARNLVSGPVMMWLLDHRGIEFKITEEIVKAAAASESGKSAMSVLLDRRGTEVQITEEVVKVAASNDFDTVKLLVEKVGAKVTLGVIEAAATNGNIDVLRLFDSWNSLGSDKERWFDISRLYVASRAGDRGIVRQLLSKGSPPDKRNIYGRTPLWVASESGKSKEVVENLLATNSVEVNVRDVTGKTPLFCATRHGFTEIVQLLLDYGAERHYTDDDGMSPLCIAEMEEKDNVVALLNTHEAATQE